MDMKKFLNDLENGVFDKEIEKMKEAMETSFHVNEANSFCFKGVNSDVFKSLSIEGLVVWNGAMSPGGATYVKVIRDGFNYYHNGIFAIYISEEYYEEDSEVVICNFWLDEEKPWIFQDILPERDGY